MAKISRVQFLELFKSVLPPESEVDPANIQDEDEADDEDDDEVSQDDQGRILENCYQGMVDALAKQVTIARGENRWFRRLDNVNGMVRRYQKPSRKFSCWSASYEGLPYYGMNYGWER